MMTTRVLSVCTQTIDTETASRFARLALDCIHREYPSKIAHVLASDADTRPPRELTPAFFGCYDWHSSVHGHWLLARLSRLVPEATFAPIARRSLALSLTTENIRAEVEYLSADNRVTFERPYGLAWLLQLAAELREWDDADAEGWTAALSPLEEIAAQRIKDWLPRLSFPIRTGEHSQTAFAFGLTLDWARVSNDANMQELLGTRIEEYYGDDRSCPIEYEPSGHDFLSPCLAEADLMRRVKEPPVFARWLDRFLPSIPSKAVGASDVAWLVPAVVTDPTDGKLAHLAGLNLSRAWMLDGIASSLLPDDPRLAAVRDTARRHRHAGLQSVTGEHYEGGHWLASFATYLVTERGLR